MPSVPRRPHLSPLQRAAEDLRKKRITPARYERLVGRAAARCPSACWADEVRYRHAQTPPKVDDPANAWRGCGDRRQDPRLYPAYYVGERDGQCRCADCQAAHWQQTVDRLRAGSLSADVRHDRPADATEAFRSAAAALRRRGQRLAELPLEPEDEASLRREIEAATGG